MHLHQHNRFIKKTQPLRPQNVRFGFWSLVAAAAQSSVVCDSLKSTPIRRLSVQLYKQKLSIYLPETLVVSPSVFLNIMVSLQNYHKPCSDKKHSLWWAGAGGPGIGAGGPGFGAGGPSFLEPQILDKSGLHRTCGLGEPQMSMHYENIFTYAPCTGWTARDRRLRMDLSRNLFQNLLKKQRKQRFRPKSN